MGAVADYLRLWRNEAAGYGYSQVLETIDIDLIGRLEAKAATEPVARELLASLDQAAAAVRHITDYERLLPLYECYAEAKVGLTLLDAGLPVERVPRSTRPGEKRPDFKVRPGRDFFVEVKSLHARYGPDNYRRTMEAGFGALVSLDERRGSAAATAEVVVQPHRPGARDGYDPRSPRFLSEELIGRLDAHVKRGQFGLGDTVLAVELSLLPLLGTPLDELHRTYPDPHEGGPVSGVLWHLAFGADGTDMFRPAEFTGSGHLDGRLAAAGILGHRTDDFVRGLWVLTGNWGGWLLRSADEPALGALVAALPGPLNNERNELWCRRPLSATEVGELGAMVRVKAYELWEDRRRRGASGSALGDWVAAKAVLGVPDCSPV